MANLGGTFDATQVEPNGDFDRFAIKDTRCVIVDSEITTTEAGDRKLNLTWKVEEGDYAGRLFWQGLNLWHSNPKAAEIAQRELSSICHATGKLNVQDSEELHHIPCLVTHGPQKKNPEYDEVKSVKPVDGSKPATGGFGGGGQQSAAANQQAANSGGGSLPWKKSA